MPRPTRIQYPSACYHVMNRGRGRQTIYHDERYYQAFLDTIAEAHKRFGVVFHAYCLVGNHYHLFVETPKANLDRIMRHINGVYTQRYNRLKRTDGPLFRGRYKAILVDVDAYLLQLSRYIHRNPVEMRRPLVELLEDYPWSSYPAYLGKANCPEWLNRNQVYGQLGKRNRYQAIKEFVELGVDEETRDFYRQGNIRSIIGDQAFKESVLKEAEILGEVGVESIATEDLTPADIVEAVSRVFKVPPESIIQMPEGRREANLPRKVAMYSCQMYGGQKLREISEFFGLKNPGGVSHAIASVRTLVAKEVLSKEFKKLESYLNIVQLF